MAYYSGTIEEIKVFLGEILGIGTGSADISPDIVEKHQAAVDELINSKLQSTYIVPLKQITRNGVTKFPDPIPYIAKRLVAASLINTYYQGEAPNVSEAGRRLKEEAMYDLISLANGVAAGTIRLEGQKLKAKNRFARPTVVPQPVVGSPVETPTGGIGVK